MTRQADSETAWLRQNDFKISMVLLLLICFLLWETRSFPMTGNYGGVESQWYVSPALFPLVLLTLLALCTFYLLMVAIRSKGFQSVFAPEGWLGSMSDPVNRARWYVIGALCVYVYVAIPAMDFYLATSAFLYTLLIRFYLENPRLTQAALAFNGSLVISVLVIRATFADSFYWVSLNVVTNETQLLLTDALVALGLLGLSIGIIRTPSRPRYVFRTVLITPLFLVVAFNFFLQVPMPVEYGSVIRALEWVWYDLMNL